MLTVFIPSSPLEIFTSIALQSCKSWDHILRWTNFVMKRSLTTLPDGTIYRYLLSVSFFGAKTCILHPVSQYFQLRTFLLLNFTLSLSNLKKRVWQGFIDKSKWKKGLEAVVSTRLFRKSFAQSGLNPRQDQIHSPDPPNPWISFLIRLSMPSFPGLNLESGF